MFWQLSALPQKAQLAKFVLIQSRHPSRAATGDQNLSIRRLITDHHAVYVGRRKSRASRLHRRRQAAQSSKDLCKNRASAPAEASTSAKPTSVSPAWPPC